MAMYLRNHYSKLRYGIEPQVDNETLITMGIQKDRLKEINEILSQDLDVD
jgi:hypothetical protein